MIVLYRIRSESPNMRKITLMLEEIGLPYAVKYIEAHDEEEQNTEFAKISPAGTAPAIVDTENGIELFESTAILHYLAEKSGKLMSTDVKSKSQTVKWLAFEAANVCPIMLELHHYTMNDSGEYPEEIFQRYKDKLSQVCAILDKELENREYLAGEYSVADIAIFPWTVTFEDMAEVDLHDFPNLQRWFMKINNRKAAQQTVTSDLAQTEWCYLNGKVALCGAS